MKTASTGDHGKVEAFQRIFKENGLKVTHQRLEIFRIIVSMSHHPSAEDVYDAVKEKIPTISFDTVYRTLALFERYGVIAKVQYLDVRTRYDSNLNVHYHLVCKVCQRIEDFYWPTFEKLNSPKEADEWGEVQGKYLELRGVCRDCLAKTGQQ